MSVDSDEFPNIEAETSFEVRLYVYDMTKGMARTLAPLLLGKPLQGIWHTGIVVYGREYFFGSNGIESCHPCGTMLGEPDQMINLGNTEIPYSVFLEFIFALGESTYRLGTYSLFEHNCNNFSQEVASFLTGKSIPQEILDLPNEILNTPLGGTLKGYLEAIPIHSESSRGISFGPVSSFEPPRNQTRKQSTPSNNVFEQLLSPPQEFKAPISAMSEAGEPQADSERRGSDLGDDDTLKSSFVSTRKSRKYPDPPYIYEDIDGVAALKTLGDKTSGQLNEEEKVSLKEILEYMTTDCGAWALGNPHLDLVGRLLNDRNVSPEIHVLMLKALQSCALKDDLILLLHQDRKDHHLMSYIFKIESVTIEEQEEIAKLLCNLCHQPSCFDWLMYISEWQEDGKPCNNGRVTVRGAAHCILNEKASIQEIGAKFMFNLSLKEIFDDSASELSMAILQYLQSELKEESAFQCLTALSRFISINTTEIPVLVKMLGPDLNKFKGKSERVTNLVLEINGKTSGVGS